MAKLERRPIAAPAAAEPEVQVPFLPEKTETEDDDMPLPSAVDRVAKAAGFDLSGQSSARFRYKRVREPRTEALHIKIKPSVGDRLRKYCYDNEMSLADVIEKLLDQHMPK